MTIMTEGQINKNRGLVWAVGAIGTAIVASACCWLPLLLLAFGISAGGLSASFEAVRGPLLGVTFVLLGIAFYSTYFRKQSCQPGSSCAAPNPNLQRFNQVMLWLATAAVLAFALFPQYVGLLSAASTDSAAGVGTETTTVTLDIDGMTCEACAMHLQGTLADVAGVHSASVSFADSRAVLSVNSDAAPTRSDLTGVIEEAGYKLE